MRTKEINEYRTSTGHTVEELKISTDEKGLTWNEVSEAPNGYPEPHAGYFVGGFENYESAEQFAKEHGGEVAEFRKNQGWHLWTYQGAAYEAYKPEDYINKLGDNQSYEWTKEDVRNSIEGLFYHFNCDEISSTGIEKLIKKLKECAEVMERLEGLEEGQVLAGDGEIIEPEFMHFFQDMKHHEIGVFFRWGTELEELPEEE